MTSSTYSINKRTREEGVSEPEHTKRRKKLDINEILREIHTIAEFSGDATRSTETIAKLEELIAVVTSSTTRPASLRDDLKAIALKLSAQDEQQVNLMTKMKRVLAAYKNNPFKSLCSELIHPKEKIMVLALWQAGELKLKNQKPQSIDIDFFPLLSERNSPTTLVFSDKVRAKLDDTSLETILQYTDPAVLKEITLLNSDLEAFPLLGKRAIPLLLQHCPFLNLSQFKNIPARCCNHEIEAMGVRYAVNKELLMRISNFFNAMWTTSLKEGLGQQVTHLGEVDPFILKGCLDLIGQDVKDWENQNKEICDFDGLQKIVRELDKFDLLKNKEINSKVDCIIANFLDVNRKEIVLSDHCTETLRGFFDFLKPYLVRYDFGYEIKKKFTHLALNRAYKLNEDTSKAENYDELLKLNNLEIDVEDEKNPATFVAQSQLYFKNKRYEEAIGPLLKAEKLYKANFQLANEVIGLLSVYKQLASIYSLLGNDEEATRWQNIRRNYKKAAGPYDHNPSAIFSFLDFSLDNASKGFMMVDRR